LLTIKTNADFTLRSFLAQVEAHDPTASGTNVLALS